MKRPAKLRKFWLRGLGLGLMAEPTPADKLTCRHDGRLGSEHKPPSQLGRLDQHNVGGGEAVGLEFR